jgi:hypothetical protein
VQEVGFPTRNEVEGGRRPVCTSAARKIGVPLVARQGRSPSGRLGFLALRGAQKDASAVVLGVGVAGRNRPAEEGRGGSTASAAREETSSPTTTESHLPLDLPIQLVPYEAVLRDPIKATKKSHRWCDNCQSDESGLVEAQQRLRRMVLTPYHP